MTEEKKENNTPERNKRKLDDSINNNNQTSEDSHPANKCDPRLNTIRGRIEIMREQKGNGNDNALSERPSVKRSVKRVLFPSTPQELEKADQQLQEEEAIRETNIEERFEILGIIKESENPKKRAKIVPRSSYTDSITCRGSISKEEPGDDLGDGGGRGGFAGLTI